MPTKGSLRSILLCEDFFDHSAEATTTTTQQKQKEKPKDATKKTV